MGAHGALIRALRQRIGASFALISSESWPWASATFVGERHRLVIGAPASAVAGIESWEFALPNNVVADIILIAHEEGLVTIEALTLGAD